MELSGLIDIAYLGRDLGDETAGPILHPGGHGWLGHGLADDRFLFGHCCD
jgi:hypothetical protein